MSVDLFVSIVSYNTRDLLRQCLATLTQRQASGEVTLDVTVADNGSHDGSPEMVETEFPLVRLVRTGGNLGFGRANNLALEGAGGRYFCVLNSDAEPEPGALARLRDFLNAHPTVGLVGGQLVWPDGRPQTSWGDDPTLAGIFREQTFLGGVAARVTPAARRLPDFGGARDVQQVSGACFLVRPEAWRAAGGFDPAYFMYNEDVDLNVRLRRAGWGVAFLPEARIRHHLGASSASEWQTRARMVASYNISRMYYFSRFFGPAAGEWVKRCCLLGAAIRLVGWKIVSIARPAARDKVRLFRRVLGRTLLATAQGEGYNPQLDQQPELIPLPKIQERQTKTVPLAATTSDGRRLRNPFLAGVLADEELGAWALDAATINYLERWIVERRPESVLEFGAGISTLCLARFLFEVYGVGQNPRVFSIEQNEWQVEKTQSLLRQHGLSEMVRVMHAPLARLRIAGRETECYNLTDDTLHILFGGTQPNAVIVDGPAGENDVRFGTLPLVWKHLSPNASFFLDDAWRDEEQQVAHLWEALPYLAVGGILQVGKGLLCGSINSKQGESGSRV